VSVRVCPPARSSKATSFCSLLGWVASYTHTHTHTHTTHNKTTPTHTQHTTKQHPLTHNTKSTVGKKKFQISRILLTPNCMKPPSSGSITRYYRPKLDLIFKFLVCLCVCVWLVLVLSQQISVCCVCMCVCVCVCWA
jgi:hypothetical protein